MPLAKFDPWQCLREEDRRAYRAYRAYPAPPLGTLGTGTRVRIDDFEERAALIEVGAGCSRRIAEHLAATGFGFTSTIGLRAAVVRDWLRLLTEAGPRSSTVPYLIADALALLNSPWIDQLVALGWDEVSLFGCDPLGESVVGAVEAIGQQMILAATSDSVRYRDAKGVDRHFYRFPIAACDVRLIWEIGTHLNGRERPRTKRSCAGPQPTEST